MKIMIVGAAWDEREEKKGQPFVGPAGGLLNAFLSAVGIERKSCYLTNVFNFRPPGNNINALCGPRSEGIPGMPSLSSNKYVRAEYGTELARLWREVDEQNPNVIAALGDIACWALLKSPKVKKLRGSPTLTHTGHKVIASYHPAAILREMKLRPLVFADFTKIAAQSLFPELQRPAREFWLQPTLHDLAEFEPRIMSANKLAIDIETWDRQITCVGFAPTTDLAIVIPFIWHGDSGGNYWPTLKMELKAWEYVKRWCASSVPKVGQNILYDCRYLWHIYGIPMLNVVGDTMLIHHAREPEMEKSLALLGSLYTDEPAWKFMRTDIKTLKKED